MKLTKIQDLNKRPITNIESLTRYVFGDNPPVEFKPNGYYEAGNYVYTTDIDGNVKVYLCTATGTYNSITTGGWVSATLPTIVQYTMGSMGIAIPTETDVEVVSDDPTDQTRLAAKTMDEMYEYLTYTTEDLRLSKGCAIIPSKFNLESSLFDLYIDGKYIQSGTYTVESSTADIVSGAYVYTEADGKSDALNTLHVTRIIYSGIQETSTVVVYVKCGKSHNAKLIRKYDAVATVFTVTTILGSNYSKYGITVPVDNTIVSNSMVFDLYYDGLYIPETMYTYKYDGKVYIVNFLEEFRTKYNMSTTDVTKYVFSFTYSRSSRLLIAKQDISYNASTDRDKYRVDISYTQYKDITKDFRVFGELKNIPSDCIVIDNAAIAITDPTYYVPSGGLFAMTHKTYVITGEYGLDGKLTKYNCESLVVAESDLVKMPIPFTNYVQDTDDILIFKESGILIDPYRYYIQDGFVKFYLHDTSLTEGELLNFFLMNTDPSAQIYAKEVNITESNKAKVKLPIPTYESYMPVMVFNKTGAHVPLHQYNISSDGYLNMLSGYEFTPGDYITFVFIDYKTSITQSIAKQYSVKLTTENSFDLPLSSYNSETDILLMFDDTGVYIGNSRYTIKDGKVVNIVSGTGIPAGRYVNILAIRKLSYSIFIDSIKEALSIM